MRPDGITRGDLALVNGSAVRSLHFSHTQRQQPSLTTGIADSSFAPRDVVCIGLPHPVGAAGQLMLDNGRIKSMSRTALITGITGQDGAYLSNLLLEHGYEVYGLVRRSSTSEVNGTRLRWLGVIDDVNLFDGDLTDLGSLIRIIGDVQPREIYNLRRAILCEVVMATASAHCQCELAGCLNMLEAMRIASPHARFYQASSSEMFGMAQEPVQTETTPFYPRPYGLCPLDGRELPRKLRHPRLECDPIQP
jgi:hypothetical protein